MWPFICVIKGEKHQTDRMKSVYVLVFHVCAKAFKADLDLLDLFAGRAERTPARLQDLTHTPHKSIIETDAYVRLQQPGSHFNHSTPANIQIYWSPLGDFQVSYTQ